MIMQPGQRWRWIFESSVVKSDLIIEIQPQTGHYMSGVVMQVIKTNDTRNIVGVKHSIMPWPVGEITKEIINGYAKFIYLDGQDSPK
jgi:hypothetical protein